MESQLSSDNESNDDIITAAYRPCATCYRVRAPHDTELCPPLWAQPLNRRHWFCDCALLDNTATTTTSADATLRRINNGRRRRLVPLLNGEEIAVRDTEVYQRKRTIIDSVTMICDHLMTLFARFRLHCDDEETVRTSNLKRSQKINHKKTFLQICISFSPLMSAP